MKTLNQKIRGNVSMYIGLLALVLTFFGCAGLGSPGMEGTYVNTAGSEFSTASDTLMVEQESADLYLIHRRTGFRLLDEKGRPGKLQYEREEWRALYEEKSGTMTEQRSGKVIRFNADHSEMTVGKRRYQRIN